MNPQQISPSHRNPQQYANSLSSPAQPLHNHVGQQQQAAVKSEPSSEPGPSGSLVESTTMQAIMAFLRKNSLKGTEETLKKELQKYEKLQSSGSSGPTDEVSHVLQSYKSDGDPTSYE